MLSLGRLHHQDTQNLNIFLIHFFCAVNCINCLLALLTHITQGFQKKRYLLQKDLEQGSAGQKGTFFMCFKIYILKYLFWTKKIGNRLCLKYDPKVVF